MARGKFDRFMVDVHIGTNRKLRRLTVPERWCHVAGILALAAQAPLRGRLLVGDDEATAQDYAELAGVSASVARSTVEKLRRVGVIVPDEEHSCERIHDWDDCNPEPKHDATAAERMRRYREKRTHRNNGSVTPSVTHRNAVTVTAGREGKRREEKEELANAPSSSSDVSRADRERGKATDDDRRLCRLVAELGRAHNPKLRIGSDSAWLRDMRLCRERDENSPEEIERLLRWVFSDESRDRGGSFWWADVIQSPGNFREHFGQMWAKMRSASLQAVPAVEDSAAFLARRGAA